MRIETAQKSMLYIDGMNSAALIYAVKGDKAASKQAKRRAKQEQERIADAVKTATRISGMLYKNGRNFLPELCRDEVVFWTGKSLLLADEPRRIPDAITDEAIRVIDDDIALLKVQYRQWQAERKFVFIDDERRAVAVQYCRNLLRAMLALNARRRWVISEREVMKEVYECH